ncbi:hypothetical protein SNEBB_000788 [Seison nebaliae]|nr:hypothetical protein SNEBB_000788 [Seison nebaliae]
MSDDSSSYHEELKSDYDKIDLEIADFAQEEERLRKESANLKKTLTKSKKYIGEILVQCQQDNFQSTSETNSISNLTLTTDQFDDFSFKNKIDYLNNLRIELQKRVEFKKTIYKLLEKDDDYERLNDDKND